MVCVLVFPYPVTNMSDSRRSGRYCRKREVPRWSAVRAGISHLQRLPAQPLTQWSNYQAAANQVFDLW